jgi:hypothetical protein
MWLVGPVPVTVEASVVLEACFGYGVSIEPEESTAAFRIEPGINVGLEIKGGVGGGIGPILEAFAGVKAAITIVELKFPIIWAFQLEEIEKDEDGVPVENMWQAIFTRTVKAEMTLLKVAISAFAELAIAVLVKLEWEFEIFSLTGFELEWELSKSTLDTKKIDLQNKTANQ